MKNSQKLCSNQKVPQTCNYEKFLELERLPSQIKEELIQIFNKDDDQISVKDAIAALKSENFIEIHRGIISLRKTAFNFDQTEFIAQENEFVPTLFYFIEHGSTEILKLEAAWIISILAGGSSEITKLIIENGIIRLALIVLKKGSSMLTMRMIQILGMLAGNSVKYRDSILQACDMQLIISKMEPQYEATYIWCLANLCIGRPSPKFNLIQPAFTIFAKVILSQADQSNIKMINDALFALGYIIDGGSNRIAILINSGVVPQLIKLLPLCNVVSILRIFEGIFCGTEDQIKYLLECGFISLIITILDPKSRQNMGDMIQTFAATETLFKVISNQNFLVSLFRALSEDNNNLRGDALELLGRAISNGTNEDANYLVNNQLIPYLLKMFDIASEKEISSMHLKKGIEILSKVLRKGEIRVNDKKENKYFTIFEESNGWAIIQKLLSSRQDDVVKFASLFNQEFNK